MSEGSAPHRSEPPRRCCRDRWRGDAALVDATEFGLEIGRNFDETVKVVTDLGYADEIPAEPFAVIREATARKGLVGMGRMVLNRRERAVMLAPRGREDPPTILRYSYEVRQDADYFAEIPDVGPVDEALDLAGHILDKRTRYFDPARFQDRH